jgi:hypothetical protein
MVRSFLLSELPLLVLLLLSLLLLSPSRLPPACC